MKYEIGREVFKQRLEERLNFSFVDVQAQPQVHYQDVHHLPFGSEFSQKFSTQFPNKTGNYVLYTMDQNDQSAARAADELVKLGYQFVYYYRGSQGDVVLDKGLN
jgi:hypothetical protein